MTNHFKIRDGFWSRYQQLVSDTMLPYQYAVLQDMLPDEDIAKSHSIENFRIAAGKSQGEFFGQVFQDSDTAKWLEAVAYSLMERPNPDLERQADEIITLIGKAQEPDGYLNTYFTVMRPDQKWANLLEGHELYCSGHMIEAGVAYFEATGKDSLLRIVRKNADLIYHIFIEEGHPGIPGHPEIELALLRLYRLTSEQRYLKLATHFIDARGQNPGFFLEEKKLLDWKVWGMDPYNTDYNQSTRPVREETNAIGHAVRAVYLYTGMAMAAAETGDAALLQACERMWSSITQKRMYLTGGIGSTPHGEAFTADYDLPNDTAYAETCASVALIFFAREMAALTGNAKYIDEMERALYNTVLASLQLDGKRFFYTNPLEADPAYAHQLPSLMHVYARRPKWHACACCPPNAARLLASLNRYVWHSRNGILYSDLFIGGSYEPDTHTRIDIEAQYPEQGRITYRIARADTSLTLALRIPAWSRQTRLEHNGQPVSPRIENGYAILTGVAAQDTVILTVDTTPHKVYANPLASADAGKCALMAGPLVYCLEDTDNGGCLSHVRIAANALPTAFELKDPVLGSIRALQIAGVRLAKADCLYSSERAERTAATLTAIPYYAWGNRDAGKMKVWIAEE